MQLIQTIYRMEDLFSEFAFFESLWAKKLDFYLEMKLCKT